jgi:Xaa-Pro aminopeptidase
MLTASGCAERRRRLWDSLPARCDALVLGDPQSLIYFANYAPSPFVFRTIDAGALLVLQPDRAVLVADQMLQPFLDAAHVDEVVAPVWYDGQHSAPHRREQLVSSAVAVARGLKARGWGVELGSVPAGFAEAFRPDWDRERPVALEPTIRALRRAKAPDEIELIRRSVRAGEAGQAAALDQIKPGMSELQAFLLVTAAATAAERDQVQVYGDFVSGARCEADRGGPPTARLIEPGDLFLLDYSVIVHGYRGDFTNTFAVGRPPTSGQRELFKACLEALEAGEAELRPGTTGRDVDRAVRGSFAARGLENAFPSHSGHGLGLSHPEPPFFVPESTDVLAVGDVVALEPGLYVPGVGGMRFERNYLITPDGAECLTHHRLSLEP